MQSKWRAPACYVGVAMICALYLAVVPGVSITDICAGAGLGAAIMWAINEWETGKWNVAIPGQAVSPVALVAAPAAAVAAAAPAAASTPEIARPAEAAAATDASAEPRARVDSGVATPETLAKWEIDEKEPSWDPSALAETWAKLRRELSISGPPRRPQVAPDLPRSAQFAQGNIAAGPGSRSSSTGAKPAAAKSGMGSALSGKAGSSSLSTKSAPPAKPSQPAKSSQPAKPALGALSKAYQESQRAASAPATGPKFGTATGGSASVSKASYTPGSSFAAPAASTATPARKVAGGGEPVRSTGSFLRSGPLRPR